MHRQEISKEELRSLYNNGDFEAGMISGAYRAAVRREGHPSPEGSGEPYCTRSQVIEILDGATGQLVAIVHQYLRPDGSIGGSGMRDPKALIVGQTLYYCR